MSGPVDTEVTPPEVTPDEDGGGVSARVGVHMLDVDNVHYEAAMQFFDGLDPERFADALLNISLALASLRGPDHAWAVMQRFTAYDGTLR